MRVLHLGFYLAAFLVLAQFSGVVAQTGAQNTSQNAAKPEPILDPASITAQPEYPEVSRLLDEQGNSQLLISVGTDGKITDVTVTKSSGHDALDEAAIEHVKKHWKFSPARQNGQAVASSMEVLMEWKLEGTEKTQAKAGTAANAFVTKNDKEEREAFDRIYYAWCHVYCDTNYLLYLTGKGQHTADRETKYIDLLTALHVGNWQPKYWNPDYYWYDLARIYLEKGEIAKAQSVAARITHPTAIATMKGDKLFDPVTTADADRYNMDKAVTRHIALYQKKVATIKDKLTVINGLASAYIIANRPQEALDLLDATLAELNRTGEKNSRFTDAYDKNWVMYYRFLALHYLKRDAEALAQIEAASNEKQMYEGWGSFKLKSRNVSQVLELAIYAVEQGHSEKALATLNRSGSWKSSYGVMIARHVRACASEQMNVPERNAALDYMQRHIHDGPYMYIRGLFCAGKMDEAAAVFIDLLTRDKWRAEDITWRNNAFIICQHARDTEDQNGTMITKNWMKLCARPDVKAALDQKAHIYNYPNYNLLLKFSLDG